MIVHINGSKCIVQREKGDPRIKSESTVLYHVKEILNKRGYNLIKKRMWKDGHLFGDDTTQYLRSRDVKKLPSIYIYDDFYAMRDLAESYNDYSMIGLRVNYAVGLRLQPNDYYVNECKEWVVATEKKFVASS